MAEGLFRDMMTGRADVEIASGGLAAAHGSPPSGNSVHVMEELGIDISSQRSSQVTPQMVENADFVLGLTHGHADTLMMLYPEHVDKIYLVRDFDESVSAGNKDISDPIGGTTDLYRRCRDQIRDALISFADKIQKLQENGESLPTSPSRPSQVITLIGDPSATEYVQATALELEAFGEGKIGVESLQDFTEQLENYIDRVMTIGEGLLMQTSQLGVYFSEDAAGAAMAANRIPGVRAVAAGDSATLKQSRERYDANLVCFPVPGCSADEAAEMVREWALTNFANAYERNITTMESAVDIESVSNAPALEETDAAVFDVIQNERIRQYENIELIASENFTSRAVMEAQGSCLTNKYAEGYPGKRWYGGCEHVDVVEQLAIDRAKELFGANFANVQPHSGSQANTAVYFSVLEPGDKILTMDLSHGGHLTHGHKMNFSGRFYEVMHYGVNKETETIDYDDLAAKAEEFKPKMITVGASAYSRVIDFARMSEIAKSVGAYLMADIAHIAGLVAGGAHPSPVGYADFVTTTTHKTLRGPRGGLVLTNNEALAKGVDSLVFPGVQGGPLMHVIAGKAVCFGEALKPEFKDYAGRIVKNAKALCDGMIKNGYRICSGTTENHVMLVDVQPQELNGKIAQETLDKAGITTNKNAIPFDTQSPFKGGGIRLGTPAVTTRGMDEADMGKIADWIHAGLVNREDETKLAAIREEVRSFTNQFPLPY